MLRSLAEPTSTPLIGLSCIFIYTGVLQPLWSLHYVEGCGDLDSLRNLFHFKRSYVNLKWTASNKKSFLLLLRLLFRKWSILPRLIMLFDCIVIQIGCRASYSKYFGFTGAATAFVRRDWSPVLLRRRNKNVVGIIAVFEDLFLNFHDF